MICDPAKGQACPFLVDPINIEIKLTNLSVPISSFLPLADAMLGLVMFTNSALLSETLKTYNKTACDSENVTLSCPRGTSIVIETAQYAKNVANGK